MPFEVPSESQRQTDKSYESHHFKRSLPSPPGWTVCCPSIPLRQHIFSHVFFACISTSHRSTESTAMNITIRHYHIIITYNYSVRLMQKHAETALRPRPKHISPPRPKTSRSRAGPSRKLPELRSAPVHFQKAVHGLRTEALRGKIARTTLERREKRHHLVKVQGSRLNFAANIHKHVTTDCAPLAHCDVKNDTSAATFLHMGLCLIHH